MRTAFIFSLLITCAPIVRAQTPSESWPAIPAPREPSFATSGPNIHQFFPTQPNPPADDPVQIETTKDERFRGTVVYTPYIFRREGKEPADERFIVLRGVNQPKRLGAQLTDVVSYRLDLTNLDPIHRPLFSPDGRELLFQQGSTVEGDGDASSWSYLYGWNFDTNLWTVYALSSPWVALRWATDSQHFLDHLEPPQQYWRYVPPTDVAVFDALDKVTKEAQNAVPANRSPRTLLARATIWSNQGTIFGTQAAKVTGDKPAAIEWIPYTQKINLLSSDAYDPCPSPDGRYVAYFGWPGQNLGDNPVPFFPTAKEIAAPLAEVKPDKFSSGGPFLYLLDRQSGRKSLVSTHGSDFSTQNDGFLAWTSDGQTLISIVKTPSAETGNDEFIVRTVSLSQMTSGLTPAVPRQMKTIATLYNTITRVWSVAHYRGEDWIYLGNDSLIEAVNVRSGETMTVAQMTGDTSLAVGLDYHNDNDDTVRPAISFPSATTNAQKSPVKAAPTRKIRPPVKKHR